MPGIRSIDKRNFTVTLKEEDIIKMAEVVGLDPTLSPGAILNQYLETVLKAYPLSQEGKEHLRKARQRNLALRDKTLQIQRKESEIKKLKGK